MRGALRATSISALREVRTVGVDESAAAGGNDVSCGSDEDDGSGADTARGKPGTVGPVEGERGGESGEVGGE